MNDLKPFAKRYVKKNPQSNRLAVSPSQKTPKETDLGETQRISQIRQDVADTLNLSWKSSGVYYVEIIEEKKTPEKSPKRIELESQAKELGVSFRDNIGDEKLEEKINKKLEE